MIHRRKPLDEAARAKLQAELRHDIQAHNQSYRAQALKLFPHVCGRCGREFSLKRLKELTVHHKDHNFKNNPPDGSNWELLCIYCHDHEHEKFHMDGRGGGGTSDITLAPSIFSPFAALDKLVKPEPESSEPADDAAAKD